MPRRLPTELRKGVTNRRTTQCRASTSNGYKILNDVEVELGPGPHTRRVVEVAALELARLYLGTEVEERCPNRNEPYRKG